MGRPALWVSRFRNSMKRSPFIRPSTTMKRSEPLALIAETMFRLKRLPLLFTTGVCPTAAQVLPLLVVGADTRFVAEEDLSAFLPGQLLDGRELNLPPALDSFRVLLIGVVERLLGTQPHPPEQPPHRALAETDLPLAPDQLLDHRSCPQAVGEAE